MTTARKYQISLDDTPYYHIMSRCVRRSYLCGTDHHTGQSYEHRRQWIEDRIQLLSSIFSIDICSYAVMSNHYHIVLKIDVSASNKWSFDEVIQRWLCVYKGPFLAQKYQRGESLDSAELRVLTDIVESWRQRLSSVSEFMQLLNQAIARQANIEERCTGRFWEGRYKSHPLLTEEALLTAMAYVDLNPIRAKMADTPETSDHTSIKKRIQSNFELDRALTTNPDISAYYIQRFPIKILSEFEGNVSSSIQRGVLFSFTDYLTLVDTTGRIHRQDKRGFIPAHLPSILDRLGIDIDEWLVNTQKFESVFYKKFHRRSTKRNAA